jgi:hypothetical protein
MLGVRTSRRCVSFIQTFGACTRWSDDPTFNARHQRMVEGLHKAGLPEGEAKKE